MADSKLFILCVLLITMGTIMSFSLSTYPAIYYHYGEFHFFIREFFAASLGIFLMWGFSYLDMDKIFNSLGFFIFGVFFVISIVLLFLPESIAPVTGGAKRWIHFLGFSLAPVEFFKIGFVFFLAWSFSRKIDKEDTLGEQIKKIIPYLVVFALIVLIFTFFQNDFGQTFLLLVVFVVLLALSGGRLLLIFSFLFAALTGGSLLIAIYPHRMERIRLWWGVFQDSILNYLPSNLASLIRIENVPEPYQIHNAGYAIFHGGFFGQGIGEGIVKLGFLSDVHTDMVLAGLSEEMGLVGFLLCLMIFMFIIFRILRIANRMEEKPHFLFCMGICLLLGGGFFINALGVTGVIPLKGIAVPFLTYGGSSMLANCIAIGIVLALSKKAKNL
ncbi:cell division/peptidoglycan biosynthesis protein [Helicobacter mustelae]|uniref:Probable peptidoglycan glycosyltransferase FtsW n=2 Tax=Helicobacter mustelae TaxID=217 RepID=D3UJ20_HELM1|nr:FtsW/RodA/SpoVE family cell cycle protein [Helicobacter mustelae]CBG40495.1 probable cell division/peptidoglycan biosynthesis protein [Helicobacter mustelae 12198]SQH71994.1 cell division/peptidoglycan biosynthesis protein [Helicobacter mustelae]STP13137.1 cell division/peptidoglycan biosynthesis protein [Helicobacter mustelae]